MVCVLMWLVQEIFVLERLAGLKKQISYVGLDKNVSFYKFFKKSGSDLSRHGSKLTVTVRKLWKFDFRVKWMRKSTTFQALTAYEFKDLLNWHFSGAILQYLFKSADNGHDLLDHELLLS